MTRRAYFYFVLTFLLGMIIGGASIFTYGVYLGRWHRGFSKQRVIRRLTRELDLSDTQVQQLNQIVDDFQKNFADLQKQVEPRFTALREEHRNRVRQILTPEQLAKYNELERRWEKRLKRRRPH